ncbi:unnamed protein product [Rhodiola kirilowii]
MASSSKGKGVWVGNSDDDDFVDPPTKRTKEGNTGKDYEGNRRKNMKTRNSPHQLTKTVCWLFSTQYEQLDEIGFGEISHLKISGLPTELSRWLVEKVRNSGVKATGNDSRESGPLTFLTPAAAGNSKALSSLSRPFSSSAASYNVDGGSSFIRGVVFRDPSKPIAIEELHMPRPKAAEILVKSTACGVCHFDLHVIKESSREIAAWIMSYWGFHHALCELFLLVEKTYVSLFLHITVLSVNPVYMYSMGGMAEYCVVPATGLCVLPHSLPYAESAILGCAVFTAYGAMIHAANVRSGDSIAVIGVGGVGSSCLQLARAFGASDIIAVDIQDDKPEKAKIFGATHTVNSAKEDAVEKIREITGGLGVDIAVEALGRPQTFQQCSLSVRDGGKAVMIGLAKAGSIGEVDINRLVRRQIKVIGSYGGRARQDLPKLVRLAESGVFNLNSAISRTYTFEDSVQAYQDLNDGKIVGRAVVEIM